ncbi:MAG TPA: thioesterase family protein [Burkholderiaceae bacterium]|nr:thioesterase family protein [Burkholderiaceae bacterium]
MTSTPRATPAAAYVRADERTAHSTALTRGPWNHEHQHAGPPIALVCGAVERTAHAHGLAHVARLTANLIRPVPIAPLAVEVMTDYVGRNAGHFSAHLIAAGREVARFTALVQREVHVELPDSRRDATAPATPPNPEQLQECHFPFAGGEVGYADLVETRAADGRMFNGPCTIWFRLRHPLVQDEAPSPYQRVAVAADSGNGISAVLDWRDYTFVNSDLTVNLLRRPAGEWICLQARTYVGPGGTGLAESTLFDSDGMIGRSTQSLSIRKRAHA